MRVEVSRVVAASRPTVWALLVDWELQATWMVDARAVEVTSERRAGVGVRLRVPTSVFGVTIEDVLEVTAWNEPTRLGVRHVGRLISGEAVFELTPSGRGTRVVWREDVDPPLGVVGELTSRLLVRPYLRWLFARSLDNFAAICQQQPESRAKESSGRQDRRRRQGTDRYG